MAIVLVIDDDPLTCDLIRYVLLRAGIEAVTARDTTDATEHLSQEGYDLVIVDVFLPQTSGVSGIQFIAQLRSDSTYANAPIIALTAAPSPHIEAQAKAAGCTIFMQKPFIPNDLKEQIIRLLEDQGAYSGK